MSALRIFGKFLISVGVGILLFVAWTLWGTGFYTEREQGRLTEAFENLPVAVAPASDDHSGPPGGFNPRPGDPVFRLRIPVIDLERIVVEGVGTEELRSGPGHYPSCRDGVEPPFCFRDYDAFWPGEDGRVVVSGHRTTYGAPFWDLDKLGRGDEIVTETKWGTFTYTVTETQIVDDDALIAIPPGKAEIVLTTCNPKFSAAQRLLVFAEMEA